jgi:hypothetical protein
MQELFVKPIMVVMEPILLVVLVALGKLETAAEMVVPVAVLIHLLLIYAAVAAVVADILVTAAKAGIR